MPVKVKCSGCNAALNVPDRARGKAVKCPKCGTGIRVPAESPAKRKPASVAAGDDDDDLFGGLDLGRVEDRSTRVCPKCGTPVGAEDVDCPMCGADLTTGGLGAVQRARAGRKGASPSEYYGKALKDAAKYLGKKQSLAWKSGLMFASFGILAMLGWLMLVWCHNWPPRAFWTFVATVLTLLIPGWVWLVQNQFIKRALEPKRDKYPVRMEPFIAISLGVKAVAWTLIFGLPIWFLFGLPGLVMTKSGSGMGVTLLGIAGGLFLPIALLSWPIVQAHFAMPITWPGWALHKVLPDVGRNIGPSLYWATFAALTAIPVIGAGVGGGVFAAKDLNALVETLSYNSDVGADLDAVAQAEDRKVEPPADAAEGAKRELREIDWKLLLWPSVAIVPVSLLAGFWTVYNARTAAFYIKLFRPNIAELLLHEREYVYVAKTAEERDKMADEANTWTATFLSAGVFWLLGIAGGVIYATFAEEVGYLQGISGGLWIAGAIMLFGVRVAVAKIAWEESALWGIGVFVIELVLIIYCIKNWAETKHQFVAYLLTLPMFLVSGILSGISAAMAAAPPEAPQP